jgi:hypothetical protein
MAGPETLDDAVKAAKKILGDKADIPEPKSDPAKLTEDVEKAFDEFKKSCDDVEAKLLAFEDVISDYKNAQRQNAAVFAKADFGLDEKSKDDAKKIKLAQKIFNDYFASDAAEADKDIKGADELDKHLIQLGKYKPSVTN